MYIYIGGKREFWIPVSEVVYLSIGDGKKLIERFLIQSYRYINTIKFCDTFKHHPRNKLISGRENKIEKLTKFLTQQ